MVAGKKQKNTSFNENWESEIADTFNVEIEIIKGLLTIIKEKLSLDD